MTYNPYEEEQEEEQEHAPCSSCNGTGMPQSGPPDVGRCSDCKGSGIENRVNNADDYDDYEIDVDDEPYDASDPSNEWMDYVYDPYGGM